MENIQVAVRFRPSNQSEVANNDQDIWLFLDPYSTSIQPEIHEELVKAKKMGRGHKSDFTFNHCFDKYKTTTFVYENLVKRIVMSSLQGINGTVFMYGQTGSGKTFTMVGVKDNHAPTHPQYSRSNEFKSPRTYGNNDIVFYGNGSKTQYTFNTQESERSMDLPSRGITNFYGRSKSPMASRDGTSRRTSDKSPMRIALNKSPMRGETPNTKMNLDAQQSADIFNGGFGGIMNHKRSSTLPHAQENLATSPRLNIPCEMDNLRCHPENTEGVLMLAMKDIFSEIEKQTDKKFFLRCSYLEIYTDLVFDLLQSQDKLGEYLTINEDKYREFYIKGATEEIVASLDEILQKIKKGEANRHYASTTMNHSSSRSHTIFRLYVKSVPVHLDPEQGDYWTESVLNFVDLAGSEKVDIHDGLRHNRQESAVAGTTSPPCVSPNSHKERVRENQHINKSLFFLTQVISEKSKGKSDAFIPYRNSPLTKILRSSLGGNSRTAIILCVNPSLSQIEQTLGTLRFGLSAKKIKNQVHANIRNIRTDNGNDEMLKGLLREYEKKICDMEMEKNKDKSHSEQLIKLIKNLQEQKNLLSDRLQKYKTTNIFPAARVDFAFDEPKNQELKDYPHYKNVGILHVTNIRSDGLKRFTENFEERDTLKFPRGTGEQVDALLDRIDKLTQKLGESEKEKMELMEALAAKDKYLVKKKVSMQQLAAKVNDYHTKNGQLQQIVNLYQNKNSEGMRRLSFDKLRKVEANLLGVLDEIKIHKAIKLLCQALPEQLGEMENTQMFRQSLYDLVEKEKNMKSHMSFGEEIDFGPEFFEPVPLPKTDCQMVKLLNTMQRDPNIIASVKGSFDPTTSYESGDIDMMSPPMQSFQHYFNSSVYRSDKYENYEDEDDYKLSKLRGSYRKLMDLIKKDNLDELVLHSSLPRGHFESKDHVDIIPVPPQNITMSSPKYNKINTIQQNTKNPSEDLRNSNFTSGMGSIESNEITNSKVMSILKTFDDKSFETRALEKKRQQQQQRFVQQQQQAAAAGKENIRIENNYDMTSAVSPKEPKETNKKPGGLANNGGNGATYQPKSVYFNLQP